MSLSLGALAAVALVAGWPVLREARRWPVAERQVTPEGRMVPLTHGLTHIREAGPEDGPVAVLVHGLTTPSFVFDGLTPGLVARGYRVISYDHYGRGRSDRPRIVQDGAIFRQHLNDVLQACGVAEPVLLVGYSMGGAVITDYAAQHPDRVARLVLLAPGGIADNVGGWQRRLWRVPLIGDWVFHMAYPGVLRRGTEAERDLPGSVPEMADRQLDEQRFRGYFRLVLASLRGLLDKPQEDDHRRIAAAGLPATAIFGAQDDVIPITARDRLAAWNPDMQIITLPDAGHGVPYTHTEAVLVAI